MDGTGRRVPLATYRLQLTPEHGFAHAAALAPYLARLGVSHAYLSPVLQAAPGSTHGYDVVDHSKASDELGGDEGFRAMVAAFHAEGLGVVLDVVPNHMAAALPENRWWWDVMENGHSSFWASFFDIDWDPPESTLRNRVLLPILGQRYGRVLADGEVRVSYDGRSFTLSYFDHVFPVGPRSLDRLLGEASRTSASPELEFIAGALGNLPMASATDRASVRRRHRDKGVLLDRVASLYDSDAGLRGAIDAAVAAVNADPALVDALLERQNYRLAFWRTADSQLDYRRFFDIDTLVALRVEDAEAFEETHAHIFGWVRDGLVDGLRIDHIDGLAAPGRYLERVAERTDGAWVVVEKILEAGEVLPATWRARGTTGYDFLNLATKVFVDPAGEAPLTAALAGLTGDESLPDDVIRTGKELILDTSLAADLNRVVERLVRLTETDAAVRDVTRAELHAAVRGIVVSFPVYRTYGSGHPADAGDVALIEGAAADALERVPDLDADVVAFVVDVLTGRGGVDPDRLDPNRLDPNRLDAARRFEQLSGPVMAKGVEDTAFYRHHRLVAENEVGSDLTRWAASPEDWHAHCARMAARGDGSLLATSTHDTKRSEDVRARLVLLSEIPGQWATAVAAWRGVTDDHRRGECPDRSTEYLLLQSFVGAWPLSVDRAVAYARKATREAKLFTSWTSPDPDYDTAVEGWVRGVLADARFTAVLEAFVAPLVEPGRVVSLAQALCKLTAPGTPDVYQGTELWDLSLVDPDNRRPVDYGLRTRILAALDAGELAVADMLATLPPDMADTGASKLALTAAALRLRRRRPWCFDAGSAYSALATHGPAAAHVLAFGRGRAAGPPGPAAGPPGPPAGSAGSEVVTVVPRLVLGLGRSEAAADAEVSAPDVGSEAVWQGTHVVLPAGPWRDVLTGAGHGGGAVAVDSLLAGFPVALLEWDQ